ncbi:MFS transporter [Foetidibacter luteolus]|uniref:MFS transporter n=1 Tax=Foetidibacter luteolus TaxID=2608880 RepID=UPI00129B8A04|nr:MFS transporter [Foetidibacter luteolus]
MKMNDANRLRILYFLVFCCTAAWLPIFADYLKDHGITGLKSGIILSVTPCMMFLVQPLFGMVADRYGYKKCLLWSTSLAAASYLLYLYSGGFAWLFMITIFMAFFYNGVQPVLDSLSLQLVQKNPSFSYGSLRIAGAAGWAVTGIVTGYLITHISTTVIFIISAISMFLAFLFAFTLKTDKAIATNGQGQSFKHAANVFSNKNLLFLLLCVVLISAGATTIWNFYSLYMKENGAKASLVGYGLSLQGICELPLFYFSAVIIRRLGLKTTLLITVFTTAARLLLYSVTTNPHAALFIELLHGISWSLFWVACVEYVNRLVAVEWRATGQSLLYAAYYGAGAIAGNLWTGFLYDAHMKISAIFLLNAAAVFVTGLVMAFVMKTRATELPYRK